MTFLIGRQETHLKKQGVLKLNKALGKRWKSTFVPSAGASGGIALFWLHAKLEFKVITVSFQALHVINSFQPWLLSIIYASNNSVFRNAMWNALADTNLIDIPWLICGDFNTITSSIGLVDLGFSGPHYT